MLCSVVLVIKALGHRTWHEVCICVQYFCIYYIYGLILILMRGRYKKEINTHTRQSLLAPLLLLDIWHGTLERGAVYNV